MNKVYQIVTDQIINKLESGVIPWDHPWGAAPGPPKNLESNNDYSGINTWLLAMQGYDSSNWLTWKQINRLGGSVKKGEKSSIVVFFKPWEVFEENEQGKKEKNIIPVMRYYRVFNLRQVHGIEDPNPGVTYDNDPIVECESVVTKMPNPPRIVHGMGRAVYKYEDDVVHMPDFNKFKNVEHFYATIFHELIHSTGHESRLNRYSLKNYKREGSYEELIAEMGSAFLCGHTGIEKKTIENAAAYIQSWLKELRNDSRLVVIAASRAQKASDYILGNNLERLVS